MITSIQFGKVTDDQVCELLKKATSFKKTDIEQAISLIKQALTIDPGYPCHEKLKSYLIIANRIDEADELIFNLISKSKDDSNLLNFLRRPGCYSSYAGIMFKKELYSEYIFYYALSKYCSLVADALNEQKETIKVQLADVKNKKEFVDRKTNKAFQEIGASANQNSFIEALYEVLKDFDFISLYNLIYYLNYKQPGWEALELEGIDKGIVDWKLWSNQQFRDAISKFHEQHFIEKYHNEIEPFLR